MSVKIKKVKSGRKFKLLIQFVDISSSMLLSESKEKETLLTLVNATVSHELRNPLNSLVG